MLHAIGVYVRSMAVRSINNDPIPIIATPTRAITSPPLQDMAESNETSTTGS
ncbi:putative jacalin-related lectin 3 [Cocos nucifera]|nr:putative jacalin-related lectin 3 [Cocos nucifera]